MRSLAREFAKTTLTVNAVCPGYVDTPMTDQSAARIARSPAAARTRRATSLAKMNANGRLVASRRRSRRMILTLCLPQSRDITGAAMTIDGGTTA